MFRVITATRIEQQPTKDFPKRNQVVNLDFCTEFECSDSWRDLTNKGRFVFPKNIVYVDQDGTKHQLKGTNVNLGGFGLVPLIVRGDRITIQAGYKYFNKAGREIEDTEIVFTGYISKVNATAPVELEMEDNMWILKQTPLTARTFSTANTLEDILKYIVKTANGLYGTKFTTRAITAPGATITHLNQSVIVEGMAAEALKKLQQTFGLEFYFRENELRGGLLTYIEDEAVTHHFRFQENIITDELEYKRKDDVSLSCVAYNSITEKTGGVCKDGTPKTAKNNRKVLVTVVSNPKNGQLPYTVKEIKRGEQVPANIDGVRLDFKGLSGNTVPELAAEAYNQLKKYYYSGLTGSFTTFGIPYVKQGDNVELRDPLLPERDGLYKVKSVEYRGGVQGLRQEVHLHYRLDLAAANNK